MKTLRKSESNKNLHHLLDRVLKSGESEEVRLGNRVIRIIIENDDEEEYFPQSPKKKVEMLMKSAKESWDDCKEW